MNKLEQRFHNAGNASMPNYRNTVTIKSKGNGIWNREISSASSKSKEAFHLWKQDKDSSIWVQLSYHLRGSNGEQPEVIPCACLTGRGPVRKSRDFPRTFFPRILFSYFPRTFFPVLFPCTFFPVFCLYFFPVLIFPL